VAQKQTFNPTIAARATSPAVCIAATVIFWL